MLSVFLIVALILFVISAIVGPQSVNQRLTSIGLAFLAAGLGALQMLGVG